MTDRLTARQREVLEQIYKYQKLNGVPPTRAELARSMGRSK